MKEIITVRGPIKADELGFCQCHEHIALSSGKSCSVNPALLIDDMEKSLEEVLRYQSAGGCSFIDAQPLGCNRMTEELKGLSEASGIHIIASTGFHKLAFYPEDHWIHTLLSSNLAELFIRELTCGMYVDGDLGLPIRQCDSRAGIIKTAYDTDGLSPRYQELFTAAAKASLQTDRVIMIHVEQNTNPVILQDFLLGLGIAPKNLIFCHMDRACQDMGLHKTILKEGSYLEFDTIGRFKYHSDAHEIQIFRELIDAGYERQLLYSLDTTRSRLKSYTPDAIGLAYILTTFNPALQAAGVSDSRIRLFSVENPARVLTE